MISAGYSQNLQIERQYYDILRFTYNISVIIFILSAFISPFALIFPASYIKYKFHRYTFKNKLIVHFYEKLMSVYFHTLVGNAVGFYLMSQGNLYGSLVVIIVTLTMAARLTLLRGKLPNRLNY